VSSLENITRSSGFDISHINFFMLYLMDDTALKEPNHSAWKCHRASCMNLYSLLKLILQVTNNYLLCAQLALKVSNARTGMSRHVI
jgi:hypothetical protein